MANSSVVGLLKVLLTAETAQFEKALAGADSHVTKLANTMKRDLEPSQKRINMLVRDFLGSKEIGLANDYAEAVSRAGGAAKLTAADQAKVNRAVTDALAHYKALGQQAPASMVALANATKQVRVPTEQLGGGLETLIGRAKMLAGVFGVTLGAGALVSVAKRAFDAADAIGDLALKMGISTDAAQRFQFAARQSGAEIEDVSRAIVAMNNNLGEGGPGTVKALGALGLKFADIRGMQPEDIFRTILDAAGAMTDEIKQASVVADIFGAKVGAELLPMIREKSLQAADGITIMSQETIKRLKDAQQAWENFWNSLTIITGNAIPRIMDEWNAMIRDLETGAKFLMRLLNSGGNFGTAFAIGRAEAFADQAMARAAARALQIRLSDPASMSSHGPKAPKILTADEEAALKRAGDAAKKAEEAYQAYRRGALGLSDALKEQLGWEIRLIHEELKRGNGLPAVIAAQFKVNQGLEGITARMPNYISLMTIAGNAELARSKALNALYDAMSKVVNKVSTKNLLGSGIPSAQLPGGGQFGPPGDSLMTRLAGGLPATIMSALTGGGGLGKSIGGMFGGEIMTSLKEKISGSLKGVLGKAFGAVLPGIGNLIGAGLGALVGKLFGPKEGARVNDMRDEFFAANGGLKAMQATIAKFSNDPQLMAAMDRMYFAKKEGDFKSGMDAYQKRLDELKQRQTALAAGVDQLTASVQVFGGVVPKSLTPLLQQLLGSANLTAEMRAQFEQLAGAPTWQVLQQRAETLGIALSALGSNFSQARISDMALQYVRDLNLFADAGADANGVLAGMADELSMVVQEAVKSGSALPKTLEPYLKKLSDMGMLLDENGNRIDMGALSFKDIEDEALKQVVTVLEQIRDLLLGIPLAAQRAAQGLTGWSVPKTGHDEPGFDMGLDSAQLPSFAGGTHGAYMDFGPGTPVMLHGQERVSTRGEGSGGTFNIYAIDAPSFETFLKQRGGAEAVVRSLPAVVERWGGAR